MGRLRREINANINFMRCHYMSINKGTIVLDWCYYDTANTELPSFYEIFAAVPKYELESFEDWCWSFGCNPNLISDLNIYNQQVVLAKSVVDFFTVKELEQLEKVY